MQFLYRCKYEQVHEYIQKKHGFWPKQLLRLLCKSAILQA